MPALLIAANASAAFAASPIAWYKLDETVGATAADSSGTGNTGTYTGSPTLGVAAVRRLGIYCSNGSQYAVAPASATLNALGAANADFSIAFWVKPNGVTGGWRPVFHKGSVDTERGPGLWFNPTNNRLHFRLSTTAGYNEGTDTVADLANGVWAHIACVKAGNKWRCYVNGVLDTEFTLIGGSVGNSGPLYIGDDPWYTGSQCWFDDVRIYNTALTVPEIKALVGDVGYWKLDETSGTTAADASSAGNTGTYAAGTQFNQTGLVGTAANFDGVDDYVMVPESASLVATDSVAISAWIRPVASANIDRMIINKEGEYELAISDTGEIKWAIANTTPGWNWHQTGVFVSNDRWSHVAVSYDGAEVRTYLNGVLVETYAASGNIGDAHPTLNELRMGGRTNNPAGKNFAGKIDDVHVYTRAVSAVEAANLHGLVGHWTFDESVGTAVNDSTAIAAHAAFSGGAPSWTAGIRSSALNFNGITDEAATNANFSPPSTGTVAFWFRSSGTPTARQRIFGLGTDWEAWQDPDGIIRFDICGDGNTGGVTTPAALIASRWYHVVVTYDSTNEAYAVYLDGELVKSGTSASGLTAQAAAKLSFGVRTGTAERFAGALDDFRVYNRRLNPAEVYEVFGLVGWYQLNETSGAVAADSTGLGRDGATVGVPTLGAPSNGSPGMGTCFDFNGSNSVQIPGLYDKSANISIAAWARLDGADSSGADVVSIGDYFVIRLTNGAAQAYYYNGSSWSAVTANRLIAGTGWHHYAAVLNQATSTFKLYIGGVEAASASATAISYTGQGMNTRFAAHGNGQTTYDLDGAIDDVRIYNRALQPEEVYRVYDGSRIKGVRILTWAEIR